MRNLRSVLVALFALGLTAPASARAQVKDEAEDFMRDVVKPIFGPHWTFFAHGGATTNGRFMLENPAGAGSGQRALRSEGGWNAGGGAGVDILSHVGLRVSYTYASRDLEYRTDNGDRSDILDIEDVGKLQTHMAAVEVLRYMIPLKASINPYAGIGLHGTWWVLDEGSTFIDAGGGSTQFRWGALASFGMLFRITDGFDLRFEASSASVGNPFTGHDAFRSFGGTIIDEPSRVNQTDYRIALAYTFGRP